VFSANDLYFSFAARLFAFVGATEGSIPRDAETLVQAAGLRNLDDRLDTEEPLERH
jgi:hypothetical protein